MFGLLGILLALALLITLAYRGHSVLVVAPISAAVAVIFAGAPLLASYTQVFMPALGGFVVSFFPLFITGAIFGKLMSETGYARAISDAIVNRLGADRAVLATVVTGALLTYGGISVFVVAFGLFPIARELFRAAAIPRRMIPATMALGTFTFTMSALPGSPQVQNAIPTAYFGTTTFAAPVAGLVASVLMFALGYMWLTYRVRKLKGQGEGFDAPRPTDRQRTTAMRSGLGPGAKAKSTVNEEDQAHNPELRRNGGIDTALEGDAVPSRPPRNVWVAIVPLVIVVGVNLVLSHWVLKALDFGYLATERFGGTSIDKVAGLWSVVVAVSLAIAFIVAINIKDARGLVESVHEGAKNSVLPIFATGSEVGFGAVIASVPAFTVVRDGLLGLSSNPLVSASLSTTALAGITGSASGGMTIALQAFGEDLRSMAVEQGVSLELLHRVTAVAAGGLDTLPHSGAIITLFVICGVTHRQAYKDFAVITIVIPLIATAVLVGLGTAGLI
jgi:H+/gluconate symporter-like permease